jgi:hypothetical protein
MLTRLKLVVGKLKVAEAENAFAETAKFVVGGVKAAAENFVNFGAKI